MKKLLKTLIPCICGVSMLFTPMVSNAAEQSDDVMQEINNTYSGVSDISTETSEEDNLSGVEEQDTLMISTSRILKMIPLS